LPSNLSPYPPPSSYSYLQSGEPSGGYLRRPLHPRPTKSPQFHRPSTSRPYSRSSSATRSSPNLSGMRALVDSLSYWHLRARSKSPPPSQSPDQSQTSARYEVRCHDTTLNLSSQPKVADQVDKSEATKSPVPRGTATASKQSPVRAATSVSVSTTLVESDPSQTPSNVRSTKRGGRLTAEGDRRTADLVDIEHVIELAHYPDARRPSPNQVAPIERDDFPAPPFPYASGSQASNRDSTRASGRSSSATRARKTSSSTGPEQMTSEEEADGGGALLTTSTITTTPTRRSKSQNCSKDAVRVKGRRTAAHPRNSEEDEEEEEDEDEFEDTSGRQGASDPTLIEDDDEDDLDDDDRQRRARYLHELRREQQELKKISTGLGQLLLSEVKQREVQVRTHRVDPRNASRTPSAKVELPMRLRYDNPVNACKSVVRVLTL
jgi:hypothetical protein